MTDPLVNTQGMTELHLPAYEGDPVSVSTCLAGGLDVHVRDKNGYTPFHWAVDMGCPGEPADREAVVRALVAAGADVLAADDARLPSASPAPRATGHAVRWERGLT
jgi:ankyrin repeat protein